MLPNAPISSPLPRALFRAASPLKALFVEALRSPMRTLGRAGGGEFNTSFI